MDVKRQPTEYEKVFAIIYLIRQRSPTFLAPGNSFVEDNFSMESGGGGDGSDSNVSNGG